MRLYIIIAFLVVAVAAVMATLIEAEGEAVAEREVLELPRNVPQEEEEISQGVTCRISTGLCNKHCTMKGHKSGTCKGKTCVCRKKPNSGGKGGKGKGGGTKKRKPPPRRRPPPKKPPGRRPGRKG